VTSADLVHLVADTLVGGIAGWALVSTWALDRAHRELAELIRVLTVDLADTVATVGRRDPELLHRVRSRMDARARGMAVVRGGKA
jgi:hypothetical protein